MFPVTRGNPVYAGCLPEGRCNAFRLAAASVYPFLYPPEGLSDDAHKGGARLYAVERASPAVTLDNPDSTLGR